MTVDFRCARCGKLLRVDGEAGQRVRCEHCHKKVVIPSGLAGLPRPHIADASDALRVDVEPEADPPDQASSMAGIAALMPWVLSGLLHVGLFLVMVFIMLIGASADRPQPVVTASAVWDDRGPVGQIIPGEDQPGDDRPAKKTVTHPQTSRESEIDVGETEKEVELLAAGDQAVGDPAGALGLDKRRGTDGPGTGIKGVRGRGYHVVYVIDRSGSMAPYFDDVRMALRISISELKPSQDFHIVFFSNNKTVEGPRERLVQADKANKKLASRFIGKVQAVGQTTALVALKRAFEILKHADRSKPGRVIFLLTDGDFGGITGGSSHRTSDGTVLTGNEAVIQWLRENNARREVQVNTLLIQHNDPRAKKVLETIAKDNHGKFKYVSPDE
jgi:DNA-directed RNA polymerase subunit RPC12/RpoP/Mg-chelatase subunit ChlD